ncbi:MAG: carbon-nitrogen hydrolase [Gammaproteobacteria bacterium]|nr:MAG: carbon-nitrogen hydrolase [Gammaproteobacteria bacterium]
MTHSLVVGLVQQHNQTDQTKNLDQIIQGIRDAAHQGAQLVLLQELHNTLYFCQQENESCFDLAETIPGPTTKKFGRLAIELGVVIVASVFEKRTAGIYHNTAVVIEQDGSLAGSYRKMHIPDDPGYYEKFYFTPGDRGFTPINTSLGKLGVLICWDQWYPEAARLMALKGAEILLYPTAIGWEPGDDKEEQQRQLDSWVTIQRAHAIANGLPLLVCNRVGHEADPAQQTDGIQFWGNSFISGPQGEILAQAGNNHSALLTSTIDLDRSEKVRRSWPFLRDRRIDAYQDLLLRYQDNPD